jgi:hypothetical protein
MRRTAYERAVKIVLLCLLVSLMALCFAGNDKQDDKGIPGDAVNPGGNTPPGNANGLDKQKDKDKDKDIPPTIDELPVGIMVPVGLVILGGVMLYVVRPPKRR